MNIIYEVFCVKNKDVLNKIVEVVPSLLEGSLEYLISDKPEVINFVNKEKFIRKNFKQLYKDRDRDSTFYFLEYEINIFLREKNKCQEGLLAV